MVSGRNHATAGGWASARVGVDVVERRESFKKKVKVTLVQALSLCTGRTVYRMSRGIALPFHDHGTRRGVRDQRHAPAALCPPERPGTHEAG